MVADESGAGHAAAAGPTAPGAVDGSDEHGSGRLAGSGTEAVAAFYCQPYFHREYIEQALASLSPPVREKLGSQIINPFASHGHGVTMGYIHKTDSALIAAADRVSRYIWSAMVGEKNIVSLEPAVLRALSGAA